MDDPTMPVNIVQNLTEKKEGAKTVPLDNRFGKQCRF